MPKVLINGFPKYATEKDIKISAFLSNEFDTADAKLVFQGEIVNGLVECNLGREYFNKEIVVVVIGLFYGYQNFKLTLNSEVIYHTIKFEEDKAYIEEGKKRPNKNRDFYEQLFVDSVNEMKDIVANIKYSDDRLINIFPVEVLLFSLCLFFHEFLRNRFGIILFEIPNTSSGLDHVSIASILAGLFGLTFTAFTFFRESLRKRANETTNDLLSSLQEIYFVNLIVLTLVTILSISILVFSKYLIELSYFSNIYLMIPTYYSILLFIMILYFMVELLDPNETRGKIKGVIFIGFIPLIAKYISDYIFLKISKMVRYLFKLMYLMVKIITSVSISFYKLLRLVFKWLRTILITFYLCMKKFAAKISKYIRYIITLIWGCMKSAKKRLGLIIIKISRTNKTK